MQRRAAGFTLAEMAIVLVVVGLLLTSVLSTVSAQIDARNLSDTRAKLDQIKDALVGYAQANGRLPCPADGTIPTGAANAGLEVPVNGASCTNANGFGVLPWATLGVPEADIWGRRFGYKVSTVYSDAISQNTWNTTAPLTQSPTCTAPTPTPTQSSFALCSLGGLTVTTRTPTNKAGSSISNLPVVIVSYGKNGYGAYTSGGTQIVMPPAGNADETANATATSWTFYSRELTLQTGTCSDTAAGQPFCEYDDVLAFIPANVLVTKLVSAGKLP